MRDMAYHPRDDGPMRRTLNGGKANKAPAWCYLCGESHLYLYPCDRLQGMRWYRRPPGHTVDEMKP